MIFMAFDSETVPNQSLPPACIPQFDLETVKYGNAKKPELREAIEAKARIEFKEKLSKRMSLDPTLCSVCTFCSIVMDSDSGEVWEEHIFQLEADDNHDDLQAVANGWECIRKAWNGRMPIVSYNGNDFDFPVMRMRAILQDVPVAAGMYSQLTSRYDNTFHYDLYKILEGWYKKPYVPLEYYLQLFSLGTKGGMDGSMVYPMYQEGKYSAIMDYCKSDVLSTAKLFCRVLPWIRVHTEGA